MAAAALFAGASRAATFDCVMEPSLTVKLGSPVASILSRVMVERGDRVLRGQVVAQIEASVEEAVVAANEERAKSTAEIEAKQTILKQKSSVMQRKGDLLTRNSGSVQDAENAQADFRVAEQEVLLAQLGKRMAELELAHSRAFPAAAPACRQGPEARRLHARTSSGFADISPPRQTPAAR